MLMRTKSFIAEEPSGTAALPNPGSVPSEEERWRELRSDPSVLAQIAVSSWLAAGVATLRLADAHRRLWTRSFA